MFTDEIIVAVDVMGGDFSPLEQVNGIVEALKEKNDLKIIAVGNKDQIENILKDHEFDRKRLEILHTNEVIEMNDSPVLSIKRKKDSSMIKAIDLVKNNDAMACISSGNTGALMVASQAYLKKVKGVKRPPLAPIIPTQKGPALLVDCGANVDLRPDHLVSFAILGTIFLKNLYDIKNPKVAIVNIGSEEEKGNKLVKESFPLLKECKSINFVGSIEARDIFKGEADIILCDAFVGNVILKLTEGILALAKDSFKQIIYSSILTKLGYLLLKNKAKEKLKPFDTSNFGGAPLLGLEGLVLKCHGNAKRNEIKIGILQAYKFIKLDINKKIFEEMENSWN